MFARFKKLCRRICARKTNKERRQANEECYLLFGNGGGDLLERGEFAAAGRGRGE